MKQDVLTMGAIARDMLRDAVKALVDHDLRLAEDVLKKKSLIRKMDLDLEQRALQLVALYQPMAKDLRVIAACLKSITYIARIGRYGKDIASTVKDLHNESSIARDLNLEEICESVIKMIDDALTAFKEENLIPIHDISERDDAIDVRRWSVFKKCIECMMADKRNIQSCAYYMMVARYLERCGDHACKIAEKVHFMVTGEPIEYK